MGHRILLADDSLTIQKVVELTFSESDYELMAVGSGDRAVEALDEFRPDIVLADVVMPGLTGYEVCEAVKRRADGAAIPVILLTGTFEPFDRPRAERVGCDSIVTKPFDSHALSALVEDLIAKGASVRAALAAAPPPAPPAPPAAPEPEPVAVQEPFSDTVAFRPSTSLVVEDVFTSAMTPAAEPLEPPPAPPEIPAFVPPPPPPPLVEPWAAEPVAPFEPSPLSEAREAFSPESAPFAETEPEAPQPLPTETHRPVDEITHPLLIISPPEAPVEDAADLLGGEAMQPRDIERDLEAFEQTGKGKSRPEVWDQAEALGVVSRVETSSDRHAFEPLPPAREVGEPETLPAASETGELEALAAQASVTDLSQLIPAAKAPAPGPVIPAGSLTEADVERIARRVVELIAPSVVRDVAWEVVPDLAERAVRTRLAEIEKG